MTYRTSADTCNTRWAYFKYRQDSDAESSQASKHFLFEKKKQKTFAPAGCGNSRASAHRKQKFFGYFFSKK